MTDLYTLSLPAMRAMYRATRNDFLRNTTTDMDRAGFDAWVLTRVTWQNIMAPKRYARECLRVALSFRETQVEQLARRPAAPLQYRAEARRGGFKIVAYQTSGINFPVEGIPAEGGLWTTLSDAAMAAARANVGNETGIAFASYCDD